MKIMWNYIWFLLSLNVAFTSQNEVKKPYIPPEGSDCKPNEEYKNRAIKKCCRMCPPGEFQSRACSEDSDTVCKPCRKNTFTEYWNRANCYSCMAPCSEEYGLEEIQSCSTTHNRKCACQKDKYCSSGTESSGTCNLCSPYTSCAKGYGVAKQGTPYSDSECTPCQPGTFSDVESYKEPCKAHTDCEALGQQVLKMGTNVSNTVCSGFPRGPAVTDVYKTSMQSSTMKEESKMSTLFIQWTASTSPSPVPVIYYNENNIALVAGILGGAFVAIIVAFVLFVVCKLNKKEQFPVKRSPEDIPPEKWNHTSAVINTEPEEQRLLDSPQSSNSSLDENGASHIQLEDSDSRTKKTCTDRQQKSSASESFKEHDGAKFQCSGSRPDSDHICNGGAQVNVTCIVNVCNSEWNSTHTAQSGHNDATDLYDQARYSTSCSHDDDIPLSSEEQSKTPEEDVHYPTEEENKCLHKSHREEGKEFHISVQDTGMETL